jgi:hypothetical protein
MDKLMPGNPPTIVVTYNGAKTTVSLTRRRFLCSLFAFLTASSLALTLFSIFALAFARPIAAVIPAGAHDAFKALFSFVYLAAIAQMTSVTLWGIYYLGERIHTPDS